jgi:hypothetical protein
MLFKCADGMSNYIEIQIPVIHEMTTSAFLMFVNRYLNEMYYTEGKYIIYYIDTINNCRVNQYVIESDELFCKKYTNYLLMGMYFNFKENNSS